MPSPSLFRRPAPHRSGQTALLGLGLCAAFALPAAANDPLFIAGTTPGIRPEGAPVIGSFTPDANWQARALHGIEGPVPASILGWLDDQGAWFSPFLRPGMTGPYDIRHWHQKE